MVIKRQIFVVAAFLLFSGITAKGQVARNSPQEPGPSAPASVPSFSDLEDLIHFGDLIEVDVVGSTEFDWRGFITPEGFLNNLRLGGEPIFALCKTGEEVADSVRESYSRFLNNPQVRVTILDRSKRPLALLLGAVRLPQRFSLLKGVSLRQLIIMSGGLTENARGDVQILRQSSAACIGFPGSEKAGAEAISRSETVAMNVSIVKILSGDPDSNPEIYYGDFITVMEAVPIYVIGDVKKPGRLSFTKGLSVQRAINAAGGLLPDSKPIEVRVFRRNPDGSEVIKLDSGTKGSTANSEFELREYDIVEVFGGRGKRLEYPPVLKSSSGGPTKIDSLPIRIVN